jgi:hypothetical protein
MYSYLFYIKYMSCINELKKRDLNIKENYKLFQSLSACENKLKELKINL